ncbi:TPA: flagellar biosynthesis protein FlgD [Enterobacter kobei]|nr:flagellar biosynthesis protein FlgD [Enterobacter kobei]
MAVAPLMSSTNSNAKLKASTSADGSGRTGTGTGTSASDLLNNFMTLLVAQMQNQDPTNPMDNSQMTSQLAQFNTAAGVEQLNDTLNNVGTLVNSMQQMNAAEWVGRSVLVEGKPVVDNSDAEGANESFSFSLPSDADNVEVTLTDIEGNSYRAEIPKVKAGVHTCSLHDMKNFQPSDPPKDTTYTVSFTASNGSGDAPEIVALKKAKVDSVSFSPSGAVLQLGVDGSAMLSEIYEIE